MFCGSNKISIFVRLIIFDFKFRPLKKMNNRNIGLLLFVLSTAMMGGCGSYSKVLKTGDREQMYQAALRYYDDQKYYKVISLADEILPRYYGSEREDSIAYLAASSNYKLGNFHTSSVLCDNFRRRFPRSVFTEDIEYMYAKGYYYTAPAPYRDATNTRMAISTISEYLTRYPQSIKKDELEDNITELRGRLYDKEFLNAKVYFNVGYYKSASVALRNALDKYPETPHREELMYLITKSDYMLAHNSVEHLKRDRYMDMMDAYYNFASEYPESKHMKELDKMMEAAKEYVADKDNAGTEVDK